MVDSVLCAMPSKISSMSARLLRHDSLLFCVDRECLEGRGVRAGESEECLVYASGSIPFNDVLLKLVFQPLRKMRRHGIVAATRL